MTIKNTKVALGTLADEMGAMLAHYESADSLTVVLFVEGLAVRLGLDAHVFRTMVSDAILKHQAEMDKRKDNEH